jgi:monofunctional biosynthetic peptidoglycan transglycosylase
VAKSKKGGFIKNSIRRFRRLLLKILILLVIITVVEVIILKLFNPPFTVATAKDWIQHRIRSKEYKGPLYLWRDLNEISPHLRKAVLAGEDQRFLYHYGFDFIEVKQALKDILFADRTRGASTISMQVARSVYLVPNRTVSRKLAEAYYTVLIELFWKKERIFEMYLNTVDWGKGIMGAEAASMRYFRTHADRLSPAQAGRLAAILPSPHKWSPTSGNSDVDKRFKWIMKHAKRMPLISCRPGG